MLNPGPANSSKTTPVPHAQRYWYTLRMRKKRGSWKEQKNGTTIIHIDGTDQSHRAFPPEWYEPNHAGDPPVLIEVETVPALEPAPKRPGTGESRGKRG